MPNDIEYRTVSGRLSPEVQEAVTQLYESVFATSKDRIAGKMQRKDLSTIIAETDNQIVGFKIGYGYDEIPHRFYSWLGGVHPDYRGRGIGAELMRRQHAHCRKVGFTTVRTKTTNQWPAMLRLNIRHGFRIIGTYLDDRDEIKIILEKQL